MSKQFRPIPSFTGIRSSGPITVLIKFGAKESAYVEGDSTILPFLDIFVDPREQQILQIRLAEEYSNLHLGAIQVTITARSLTSLELSGRGKVLVQTPINTPSFQVMVTGGGDLTATVNASLMNVFLLDTGAINLAGQVSDASIALHGAGTVNGDKLAASTVVVDVKGCGQVFVKCLDSLVARVQGTGNVKYRGAPQVTKMLAGTGVVAPY